MRTSLCIAAALLLAAVLALTGLGGTARAWAAEPDWAVDVREGDAAALAGLSMQVRLRSGDRLQWDSRVALDTGAQETEFLASLSPIRERSASRPRADLYTDASFGIATTGALDAEEMEREGMMAAPIAALYEKTLAEGNFPRLSEEEAEANQNAAAASVEIGPEEPTAQARVDLSDYYDFAPLAFDLHIPGAQVEISDEARAAIAAFFRIPVPKGSWADVSIEIDAQGNLVSANMSSLSGPAAAAYSAQALSAVTEEACFLALANGGEGRLDLSHVPGGNGVYVLPLRSEARGSGVQVTPDADALCNAYPLPAEARVQGLFLDDGGEAVRLYTREGDELFLTVLDLASLQAGQGEALQRVRVCAIQEEDYVNGELDGGDFLLVQRASGFAAVLARGADGLYAPAIEMDLAPLFNEAQTGLDAGFAADWDGERLAAAALPRSYSDAPVEPVAAVYGAEGLRCLARLRTPLAGAPAEEAHERMELSQEGFAVEFAPTP